MSRETVSVVVPTIGNEAALARCLAAILAGTSLPADVVVVDQSGAADVTAVVDRHRGRGVELRLVTAERHGLSAARNLGARAASGDVLAFTDDDCVPDLAWVTALTHAFAPDVGAVTGPMLPLPTSEPGLVPVSSRASLEPRRFDGPALPWEVGTGGNTSIRRDVFERLAGFDERLGVGTDARAGEDLDLYRRMLGAGEVIVYEPDAVCRHEQKTPSERTARRWAYGMGAGSALGRWLRDGDLRAVVGIVRWTGLRLRLAAGRSSVRDELRVLAGTVRGMGHGVRLPPFSPS